MLMVRIAETLHTVIMPDRIRHATRCCRFLGNRAISSDVEIFDRQAAAMKRMSAVYISLEEVRDEFA